MSALQTVKDLVPGFGNQGVETDMYECQDCFELFESAKDPERVQCPDCLAHEVEQVEEESISEL